jgi:PAS domain S-box-containing protein
MVSRAVRKNLPVTTLEYPVGDDTMIVSKTDLKGKLTYFNDQFVKVSGFSEQELLGKPHNIVRHPDMPPEADSARGCPRRWLPRRRRPRPTCSRWRARPRR